MGQLVFQATAGGQVALVGPNPTSNFSLNVPAVNGNLVTTGDTGTVTNTMLASSAYTAPGTIGSGTPNSGAFTTLSASSTVSGTGFSTYLASPPAIGGTSPSTGKFTSITNTGLTSGYVVYAGAGGLESGSANLFWDNTNSRLGVGTSSPSYPLHVYKSGDCGLLVESNTGAASVILGGDGSSGSYNFIASNVSGSQHWYVGGAGNANTLVFSTAATERMRIDSSGNVGIGATSPSTYGKFVVVTGTDKDGANIVFATSPTGTNGGSLNFWNYTNTAIVKQGMIETICTDGSSSYSSSITFSAAKSGTLTEAMRIDSSGNLLIGETALYQAGGVSISKLGNGANSSGNILFNSAGTSNYPAIFQYNGSNVGYITYTNTIVQYVSLSDYRLKENITPMTGALETIAKLKPVTYDWKTDGSSGQGFIAHELAEVCPQAVNGEKDAVDKDGKPKYQGIDTSFLVASLTAAIQELNAKVTALEAKLGA
jgi:hypothetical protein